MSGTATAAVALRTPDALPADDLLVLAAVAYDVRALNDGTTHEPFGNPAGPGLWHHKGEQLPAYIQQVAHGLVKSGMDETRAIATAVSRCKVWCAGGQKVHPDTRAKACAAVAEWEALKARSTHKAAFVMAYAFDSALHPRLPAGGPGGGRFAPGSSSGTPSNAQPVAQGESTGRVTDLQNRLKALGYKLNVDGKFGPKTLAAVRSFQRTHHDASGKPLKVDGLVGPLTTAALRLGAKSKIIKPKVTKKTVTKPKIVKPGIKMASVTLPEFVTIPAVELLAAGTWELSSGRNTFTPNDIAQAIEAAACPAVGSPVIKLGHVDPRFDGEPAIGRVVNLRANDNGFKLVGDLTDMPGWFGGIAKAAFPRRSIEGSYGFRCQIGHTHPFVVTALALLGVTAPGVGVLGGLPDIAELYGVQAAAAGDTWRTAPLDQGGAAVAVTEEDVRRAYYANSGAPNTWWITELQMSPTQLIVAGDDGQIFRVPFTIGTDGEDAGISFGVAEPLANYGDLAAARGSGRLVTYATAEVSRSVAADTAYSGGGRAANNGAPDSSDSNNGWVLRGGQWEYDPDNDGDDDSQASTDTDNSHWDSSGKQTQPIPPKPTRAAGDAPGNGSKPYGNVRYADPKNGKYPIDTADHARAAWSYINKPKNAGMYPLNGVSLAEVKAAIMAACKKFGITVSDDAKTAASMRIAELQRRRDLIGAAAAADADDDTRQLIASLDATLDEASALVPADTSTLPPDVAQALALLVGAESIVDDLMDLMGIYDPDDDDADNPVKADAVTPPTLSGDAVTGDANNAMMGHGPCTTTHSHAHPAYGAQGGDATHAHQHSHMADNNHAHTHAATNRKDGSVDFTTEQEANLRTVLGLGEDEDLTPERVLTASAALKDKADAKVAAAKGTRAAAAGVITVDPEVWDGMQRKIEASERFRAKVQRDERDDQLDAAIRDGKFSAARRTHWSRLWDADPEGTREVLAGLRKNTVPVEDIGFAGGNLDDDAYEAEFASLYPPGTLQRGR